MRNKSASILLCILFYLLLFKSSQSQIIINAKFLGLSGHLKKSPHPHLYKRKLDENGFAVLNIGAIAGIEKSFFRDWFSVKFVQAILSDCAVQTAGFTHIGFRLTWKREKHIVSIGNGPTLFYRKDWKDLPGYVDEGFFKRNEYYQYIFFWYAGEVEYHYKLNDELDIGISFIPGPPEFFTIAPGIRYNIQ